MLTWRFVFESNTPEPFPSWTLKGKGDASLQSAQCSGGRPKCKLMCPYHIRDMDLEAIRRDERDAHSRHQVTACRGAVLHTLQN
jgi:hypothetical protein